MFSSLALIVLLPFVACWLPVVADRADGRGRNASAWGAGAVLAVALVLLLMEAPAVFDGEVIRSATPWLPQIGLNASLRMDGLGFLFALLILGIGLLIVLYARYYLAGEDPMGRFYCYLLLFAGAMLGIVLSDNVILLVVFWELTSLSSFLLIGYWRHSTAAREGARMALSVTGAGGLCLLAGMLLLGHIAGSYELSDILDRHDIVHASPLYLPTLILILLGAFTKSAQFPFQFWLPHAMAAPTPVSAYLHSATMVKAGVFLLARMYPVLAGSDAWFYIVTSAGFATFALGAYVALFKHDLKGLLAYSTISHLGLITLLFGLQTPLSVVAGVFHIINHATFKASLFMAAGIVDHEAGTRDVRRLNGLWKYMPYTGTLAMVAAASMAGVPLFNGFLSKEMFLTETLELQGLLGFLLPTAAVLASMFSVAYSFRFVDDVFFNGEPKDLPKIPHEPPRWMRIPVEVLVLLCLAVGMLPAYTVAPLLATAVAGTLNGPPPDYSLAIWHGFNLPFVMSLIAMFGGSAMYIFFQRTYNLHRYVQGPLGGRLAYRWLLVRLLKFAAFVTRTLDTGSLQRYLAFILSVSLILGAWPFFEYEARVGPNPLTPVNPMAFAIWIMLAITVLASVVLHYQRLTALIVVSVVGLISSLMFVYFAAPDLALTQIAVEVVTIVLILLALHRLPQSSPMESTPQRRFRDIVLALGAGLGVTAIVHAVLTRPLETLSTYYLEQSVPGGGGSNVVNVILVDFRGFDTFGEIIVLCIAALGIAAMLSHVKLPFQKTDAEGRPWARDTHPMMLAVLTSVLLPLALTVGVFIFMRGHNLPGGGFVAGLVTGIALILLYIANGINWATERMRIPFSRVIGLGVFIAGLTGIGAWFFGRPFLTSAHGHPHVPLLGEIPLASAMAFDLGVYLTVVGVVMLILASLGGPASQEENN